MKNRVSGTIIIIFNLFWIYQNCSRYYYYHYTNMNFVVQIPDWILITEIIIAILGIAVGVLTYRKKMRALKGILISLGLFLVGNGIYVVILN